MAGPGVLEGLSPYFIYVLVVSAIGPLLFGFHLAELNPPEDVITCRKKAIVLDTGMSDVSKASTSGTIPQCIPMNDIEFGVISSFFTLGGLVGALVSGTLSNRYGRLKVVTIASLFFVIGSSVEAVAPSIAVMALGRFLSGIAAGAATTVVPLYISEASPPDRRGLFGTFTQIMVNVGISIALVLGYFLSRGSLWRITLATGGIIGLVQTIGLCLGGQESPKWMADHGHVQAARRSLQRLRSKHQNIDDEIAAWTGFTTKAAQEEEQTLLSGEENLQSDESGGPSSDDILPSPKSASRHTHSVFSVLKDPDARPAILAVVMIMLAQQLTGINSIIMYGVGVLTDLLQTNAALLNILVAVLNIIITMIAAPLVDKVGRKPCLLVSMAGMGINSVLLGIGIMNHVPLLSAIAVILFVASFGMGLGPVPFMLSPELVNAEAVGATQSWALAANWSATFVVAQFFPVLNKAMGKGQVYFFFAGFALLFGLFTFFFIPETKGKKTADDVWGRAKAAVE